LKVFAIGCSYSETTLIYSSGILSNHSDSDVSSISSGGAKSVKGWRRPTSSEEGDLDSAGPFLSGPTVTHFTHDPYEEINKARERLEFLRKVKEKMKEPPPPPPDRGRHLFDRPGDDGKPIGRSKFALSPHGREILAKTMGLRVDAFEDYIFTVPQYNYNVTSCRTYKRITVRKPVRTEPRHRVNWKKFKSVKKETHLDYLEDHLLRFGSVPKDAVVKPPPVPYEEDAILMAPGKVLRVQMEQNWETHPAPFVMVPDRHWNPYFKEWRETRMVKRPTHPAWIEDLNIFWAWRYSATGKEAHNPPPHACKFAWWDKDKYKELGPYSKFKDRHPRLFRPFKWPMTLEETRKFFKPEFESYGVDFRPPFKHPGPVTDLCYRACLMNLYARGLTPPVKLNGLILSP